jgi:galactosyl transferase GMA12/MNN10 family
VSAVPQTQGNFNKVSMIYKILEETPRTEAEWIWWLDIDALIVDVATALPLERYASADLVVWGDRQRIALGDMEGAFSLVDAASGYTDVPHGPAPPFAQLESAVQGSCIGVPSKSKTVAAGCRFCSRALKKAERSGVPPHAPAAGR